MNIYDVIAHHLTEGCADPRCDLAKSDELAEHLNEELQKAIQGRLSKVQNLVVSGWRQIPLEEIDDDQGTIGAFSAGRNWMIDRIREALDGQDVSQYYPYHEKPKDLH